jgi:hypothetical protein
VVISRGADGESWRGRRSLSHCYGVVSDWITGDSKAWRLHSITRPVLAVAWS